MSNAKKSGQSWKFLQMIEILALGRNFHFPRSQDVCDFFEGEKNQLIAYNTTPIIVRKVKVNANCSIYIIPKGKNDKYAAYHNDK